MTRPPRGSVFMWLLCAFGMALGLAVDCRSVGPAALAGLCAADQASLSAVFLRHLSLLPATNIGMLLGGFAAFALTGSRDLSLARLGGSVTCNLIILMGMSLAACLGRPLALGLGVTWSATAMIVAMTAGMTLGMIATAALSRLAGSSAKDFRYRRWPAAESR